ncbi:TetR/AcrR family transcriptional regulator [Actinocorallia sp. A-T 12471]|uniref:TetR/AcrR family transcriptional regulator n=1 Tax=Actinocorallia sp. A-T 12471 TaxID=3089813 RepID=UPI0029D3CF93|nr:TetR/AcrR family transcriptional regulator [Actinocorallia sp. A-T 12471]MDX6742372.1 TetR/AcrR family transcriptional regulator [Actinocorallia sp. A-T 12471]
MTDAETTGGRRERKKAATRRALADAALRLFLERGYDQVGVREIAEAADVSVTTLFNHFPGGKEALVFDEDADHEAALVAAVTERPEGQSIPEALRAYLISRVADPSGEDPRMRDFHRLVDETPALRGASRAMWMRHEQALAAALATATGRPADDLLCAAYAHFTLSILFFAHSHPDPTTVVTDLSTLLESGWTTTITTHPPHTPTHNATP